MKAVIISNGEIRDYQYHKKYIDDADLVICVDGGARHLRKLGIKPHVLLGDFDSISGEDYRYYKETGVELLSFPAEKDMTDTELAVDYAMDKGCSSVVIIGGFGTRMDHSLANIFLLKKMLDKGVKGIIADELNEITLINDSIEMRREEGLKITLMPLGGKASGISTKGLYYPLENAVMEMASTRGISNEFADDWAEVTVKEGLLLVIKSRDKAAPF